VFGVNYGMRCVGWGVFDEKVLGTVHVAIGNNVHLEGTNKASIHVDFVLHKPTVKADDSVVMQKGKLARLKLAL
jgi:leucyl aminopeptidase (aminopeptidase T)